MFKKIVSVVSAFLILFTSVGNIGVADLSAIQKNNPTAISAVSKEVNIRENTLTEQSNKKSIAEDNSSNPFTDNDAIRKDRLSEITGQYVSDKKSTSNQTNSEKSAETLTYNSTDENILIKFKNDVSYEEIASLLAPYNYNLIGSSSTKQFKICGASLEQLQKSFNGKYDYIEKDGVANLEMVANDPQFANQWALNATNIPAAWDKTTGSADILVAVIDSGISRSHEDFNYTNIRQGWDYIKGAIVTGDVIGHGTLVSGIIAATTNNAVGISGVCWNVQILPLEVFNTSTEVADISDLCQAIYDAADAGADVINLSLGSFTSFDSLKAAINYAASKGCIIVSSAGNGSTSNYSYPASYYGVVSVASVKSSLVRSDFSSYNDAVDVAAPGEGILSTGNASSSDYETVAGTSFSSPYVAGIAALAKACDKSIGTYKFHEILKNTSTDEGTLGRDNYYGYGLVNAESVLENAIANIGNDFKIQNGVLIEYFGYNGNVIIPDGVTEIAESAFSGCTHVKSVIVPDSVKVIGSNAFDGCTGLTAITLSENIISIGPYAFNNCSALLSVTLPESVTSIGLSSFSGCTVLENINIPNNVVRIGAAAFQYCRALKNINIPYGVLTIDDWTFDTCLNLTSITIPNSVTKIGYRAINSYAIKVINIPSSVNSIDNLAFDGCRMLTGIYVDENNLNYSSINGILCNKGKTELLRYPNGITGNITIPNGIKSIEDGAFDSCSDLTCITIPSSVTSIGNNSFSNCRGLTNCVIPDSVKSIGSNAFNKCESLTGVTIPNSVTDIGDMAFEGTPWLNNFIGNYVVAGDDILIKYKGSEKNIIIPDGVKSIGINVFYQRTTINSVVFPDSLIKICDNAFYGCSSLTSLIITNNVTSIGERAFYYCTGLTGVTMSNKIVSIGIGAFSNCTGLININFPDSLLHIGAYSFSNCRKIASIVIPKNVIDIGANPFSGTAWIRSYVGDFVVALDGKLIYYKGSKPVVTIPSSVKSIGDAAFQNCLTITGVSIPDSVVSIGEAAFNNCTELTSITIPNSVKSLGSGAFAGCSKLTSVVFSGNMESTGNGTFSSCTGLKSIIIPDNIKSIDKEAFSNCTALQSITIPNSVTSIGDDAFAYCSSLTTITIPNSVLSIGSQTFSECTGLLSISLPGSVKSIGEYAFRSCTSLNDVTIKNGLKTIGENAFYYCIDLTNIIIPNSVNNIGYWSFYYCDNAKIYCSLNSYAEAYAKKICMPFETVDIEVNANTNTIIDNQRNFIYGLSKGISSLSSSIEAADGTTLQIINSCGSACGTGSTVNLIKTGIVVETYTVVIFGDINGDGNIDSIDSGVAVDVQNYMTNWDMATDSALYAAGDVNGDGNIDSIDAGLLVDSENYLVNINQTTGLAVPV